MKTYGSEPGAPTTDPKRVGISEFAVSDDEETMKSYGLGSCLAVALWDPEAKIGGLAHVMLPDGDTRDDSERKPGKFADTAIRTMLRQMVELGAAYTEVQAKIAGGSDMLDFSEGGSGIGDRNVEQVRATLAENDVPIVDEDVGGDHGRSLRLEAASGDLVVKSANRENRTL